MKSIFDEGASEELIRRIGMLNENSRALWGKMTVYQMVKHCALWEEMLSGEKKVKRMFLGRLFGKAAIGYLAYKHTDHHLRQFSC